MRAGPLVAALLLTAVAVAAQAPAFAPRVLPPRATTILADSLRAAEPHPKQLWRDTLPLNADGTINAYLEIARGDRRKWEFEMASNAREIDRMIPEEVGPYPINYGFVPQTVSYDGDPFDALVLGPPLPGGEIVRGVPVGVMFMEDEKGLDSKVVLSPVDDNGRPRHQLTDAVRREVGAYFNSYKRLEPNAFSRVPGWGSREEGVTLVRLTHAFFRQCAPRAGSACAIDAAASN
jgi:inorganic pyrophosphatase